jgi:LMBR1 domain-containing protein 1
LTNIDKAIHCKDAKSGYVLRNGTLPNPTDMLLVYAQVAFPLDYIIYTGIVLFFMISSVFGVKQIGIKFVDIVF